jgi:SAM-dependent methyltransferase
MNGKTIETVEPNGNFDWNQAYTGQGERDLEAADPNFLEMIDRLKPGRALDLGCGAGGLAIELARRGWQVVGIDIAENAIASARKNADRCAVDVDFAVGDVCSWTPEGAIDLITSCFAMPGTPDTRKCALRRATDALAPGGTLMIAEWEGATVDFGEECSDDFWTSLDEVLTAIEGLAIERAEIIDAPAHDHGRDEAHTDSEHVHDCGDENADSKRNSWKAFYVRARRAT